MKEGTVPDRESAEYWNKRLAREGLRTIKRKQTFEKDWTKRQAQVRRRGKKKAQ
jgi:hypothetical protein